MCLIVSHFVEIIYLVYRGLRLKPLVKVHFSLPRFLLLRILLDCCIKFLAF